MVSLAELKAKAEKAKDAGVAKVASTRDRFSSTPSSKTNWDSSWKRVPPPPSGTSSSRASTGGPPPPPSRSRPDVTAPGTSTVVPTVPRASRPVAGDHSSGYMPLPPPTRAASGYPPGSSSSHRDSSPDVAARSQIDWANLSPEDKEAFFGWLDEFFSRYLNIELGPRAQRRSVVAAASSLLPVSAAMPVHGPATTRAPPAVNMATRPQV